jgi:hypothetical protein
MKLVSAPDTLVNPCSSLNKLRNDFAHGNTDAISQEHLDNLANTMGPGAVKKMKDNDFEFFDEGGKIIPVTDENEKRFRFISIIGKLYSCIAKASVESDGKVDKESGVLTWKWS